MPYLKQSTAVTLKLGPFVDSSDGNTEETALTINAADVKISKNGGAFASKNDSNAASHDANGWYAVNLDATDTNTAGILTVYIHVSGALPVWREYVVVPANVYDSLFSTDKLQVDVTQVAGNSVSGVNDFKADVSNLDVAVSTRSSHSAADVADAVWDEAIADHTTVGTFGAKNQKVVPSETIDDYKADVSNLDVAVSTRSSHSAADVWSVGTRSLTDKDGFTLSAAGVDAILDEVVEGSMTLRQALRIYLSALAGKSSGGGTSTITFRDLADSKNRISATVDADGNRTAVTLDGS